MVYPRFVWHCWSFVCVLYFSSYDVTLGRICRRSCLPNHHVYRESILGRIYALANLSVAISCGLHADTNLRQNVGGWQNYHNHT